MKNELLLTTALASVLEASPLLAQNMGGSGLQVPNGATGTVTGVSGAVTGSGTGTISTSFTAGTVGSGAVVLSTALSTANSSVTSLSTSTSTGLSTSVSSVTSLSTGLSTANSNVTSLSTSASTGISTVQSNVTANYVPLSTSATSTTLTNTNTTSTAQYILNGSASSAGLNLELIGNGGTTPNKYIRVYSGVLQILSSAYGGPIFALTDVGVPTFSGVTTGTNADFACFGAGGVLQLQASACTISSRRFKKNIVPWSNEAALKDILALKPVTFTMKDGATNTDKNASRPQRGLIAEQVAAVDPKLAIYEQDLKTPKSYRQEAVIAALIGAVKAQQVEIVELKKEIEASHVR